MEIDPYYGWIIPSYENRYEHDHTSIPPEVSCTFYNQHFQSSVILRIETSIYNNIIKRRRMT